MVTEAGTEYMPSKESETDGYLDKISADKNREVAEFEAEYAFSPADSDYRNFMTDEAPARGGMPFPPIKDEYSQLWAELAIRRERLPEVDSIVDRVVRHKETYRSVEQLTRVPWFVIATIHNLEAGGN
jgi:hypothetical protein